MLKFIEGAWIKNIIFFFIFASLEAECARKIGKDNN